MQPILFRSKDPRSWVLSRGSYNGMGCDIAIFDMHGSPREQISEQISEQKLEIWESESPGGPGCVVPPRQGPESGKRLGRLHIPSMSTIWALSWDIKTFLNPKYLNKTLNFHKFQLLQHFCSKNWTCSPRTSMHSTNQVKLQTHSFSTVPVPLQNSQYSSRTVHLKF